MKTDLPARLRRCVDLVGSGDKLAREANIPRSTLETYLTGKAEPKASRLADICRVCGVSGHWLLTGDGDMARPALHDEADLARAIDKINATFTGVRTKQQGNDAELTAPERKVLSGFRAAGPERREIFLDLAATTKVDRVA